MQVDWHSLKHILLLYMIREIVRSQYVQLFVKREHKTLKFTCVNLLSDTESKSGLFVVSTQVSFDFNNLIPLAPTPLPEEITKTLYIAGTPVAGPPQAPVPQEAPRNTKWQMEQLRLQDTPALG